MIKIAGDVLRIIVPTDNFNKLLDTKGYRIEGDHFDEVETEDEYRLYEVILPFDPPMTGTLLENFRVHHQHKISVLAARHRNEVILTRSSKVGLRERDLLLIQGIKND